MFRWFQERHEAERLANADADVLIVTMGERAIEEARHRRIVKLVSAVPANDRRTANHWRRVAEIIKARARQ